MLYEKLYGLKITGESPPHKRTVLLHGLNNDLILDPCCYEVYNAERRGSNQQSTERILEVLDEQRSISLTLKAHRVEEYDKNSKSSPHFRALYVSWCLIWHFCPYFEEEEEEEDLRRCSFSN